MPESTTKQAQYATLARKLTELNKNLKRLEQNIDVASHNSHAATKLAISHGSIFMSAGRVLPSEDA
ncbi:hypothetical protein K7432_003361 [Basidiobolus ranarum]|uniref:Uncharacterized protein n=1 Tax=Basidiobolus ranarum TaxID=34480 RepID=A0ABR2X037_9FUNG